MVKADNVNHSGGAVKKKRWTRRLVVACAILSLAPPVPTASAQATNAAARPIYKAELGTSIVWGEAGASGVTNTLTFEALADGSARMGAVADLGATWDDEWIVAYVVETGTAPTAGLTSELYVACTHSTSYYPAGVTGSDGAWPSDGNEDEWKRQLGPPAVVLIATNDGNTVQVQQGVLFRPPGRHCVPVIDNNLGQAFRDEATATNNDGRVIMTPRRLALWP